MTQQDREKLREEFKEYMKGEDWIGKLAESLLEIDNITDFWLSKLDSAHTETLQKVGEEILELETWAKVSKNEQDVKEYNFAVFVLKKVLSTIRNIK